MMTSNFNIHGMIALFVTFSLLASFLLAAASRVLVMLVPEFIELLGFRRWGNGVLNERSHRLNMRNGLGYDILGKRIAGNRRWKGRDLQAHTLSKTDYYTSVLNNPLRVSCKIFQKSDSLGRKKDGKQ